MSGFSEKNVFNQVGRDPPSSATNLKNSSSLICDVCPKNRLPLLIQLLPIDGY